MGFFRNLYNRAKRTISKATTHIKHTIGKAVHHITTRTNKTQQLTPQERQNITFIEQAYKTPTERLRTIGDFTYLPDKSNEAIALYINTNTKQMKMCIRGTKTAQDAIDDLDILTGSEKENARFNKDLAFYDKLTAQYPDYTIEVLGHSLGGAIANYIGRERNATGLSVNAGVGFGSNTNTGRVKNIRSSSDIVSMLGANDKVKNVDLGSDILKAHRNNSFL